VTTSVVEIFLRNKRVASHARLWSPKGSASTNVRGGAYYDKKEETET
jgi:hypothetical protein